MTASASSMPVDSTARPLEGLRIVLTRPASQAGDFDARARALGGVPVIAPAIAICHPTSWTIPDAALQRIDTYDWIAFTSVNSVRAATDRAGSLGIARDALCHPRLAALGPATATAVAETIREPDIVASTSTGEALAREIPNVRGCRVLFPHGDLAGTDLPDGLAQRGAVVDAISVYRTVPGPAVRSIAAELQAGVIDALLFASASAVRFVSDALAGSRGPDAVRALLCEHGDRPAVICIGPRTTDAARAAGFTPVATAESATMNDLLDRAALWFAERRGGAEGAH